MTSKGSGKRSSCGPSYHNCNWCDSGLGRSLSVGHVDNRSWGSNYRPHKPVSQTLWRVRGRCWFQHRVLFQLAHGDCRAPYRTMLQARISTNALRILDAYMPSFVILQKSSSVFTRSRGKSIRGNKSGSGH